MNMDGAHNEAQAFLSKGAQVIVRIQGLPYDWTIKNVEDFFATGSEPCNVLGGILFVKKPDQRSKGDVFILLANESSLLKALSRHRESIGQLYIEIFRSTTAEVQQVLNQSMDPKTYEPAQSPLITQIQPVQMPPLPQHIITKNCIILRGLPYEARTEHILLFLADFANNIIYQGVHMWYSSQDQPTGEAFIRMDSEKAARTSAQLKHKTYMAVGEKYCYIEVFQCCGDEVNMVSNGCLYALSNPTKSGLLLSPDMLIQVEQATLPPSSSVIPMGNPSLLTSFVSPPKPALLTQQQAQFIPQQNLFAYQQAITTAVAAAAQSEQQYYLPKLAILPHPQTQQSLTFPPQIHTPQIRFMRRILRSQFSLGLMRYPMYRQVSTLASAQQPTMTSVASVNPQLTSIAKRSYENTSQHNPALLNFYPSKM